MLTRHRFRTLSYHGKQCYCCGARATWSRGEQISAGSVLFFLKCFVALTSPHFLGLVVFFLFCGFWFVSCGYTRDVMHCLATEVCAPCHVIHSICVTVAGDARPRGTDLRFFSAWSVLGILVGSRIAIIFSWYAVTHVSAAV